MKIERFGVVGCNISHTMSPYIHNVLFNLSGYSPIYDVLDIESIPDSQDILKTYDGLNVTIPHKKNIIEVLKELDEQSTIFSSVNTVKNNNGFLSGYTTDGKGALQAISSRGGKLDGTSIILGTGGAGRAISAELNKYNGKIIIAGRDIEKAKKLANQLDNAKATTIKELDLTDENYSLLINATSVGMYPNSQFCPTSENLINRCDTVFDAVYNPCETSLISLAKTLGKRVVYGMDMLVYQAVIAHKIWYGAEFNKQDIEDLITNSKKECVRKFFHKE